MALVSAAIAVVRPSTLLKSFRLKLGFLLVLWLGYFGVEAMVAPFYPAMPATLKAYGELVLETVSYGPCG